MGGGDEVVSQGVGEVVSDVEFLWGEDGVLLAGQEQMGRAHV